MKWLFLLIVISLIALPAAAQRSEEDWRHGCVDAAADVIAPIMGEALYSAACEARQVCVSANDDAIDGCDLAIMDALMAVCRGEHCALQSRFYAGSLLIFEQRIPSMYSLSSGVVRDVLADTFTDFHAGDYQAVIDTYAELSAGERSELNTSPYEAFVVGLMYEALDEPEQAAEAYRRSIELYRMPLVTAQRAAVLDQLGYADVAAAEVMTITHKATAEALTMVYPLPDGLLEDWVVYEVGRAFMSESPTNAVDETALPGMAIQVAFLSDGSLLVSDPDHILSPFWVMQAPPDALVFYQREANVYASEQKRRSYIVTISFAEGVGNVFMNQEYVMGFEDFQGLLAPADAPDPREGRYQRCGDGARWRLQVGGYGRSGSPNQKGTVGYYDAPDGEEAGIFTPELYTYRVVGEPVCVGSVTWWEIELVGDGGTTYWTYEAQATDSGSWVYVATPTNIP